LRIKDIYDLLPNFIQNLKNFLSFSSTSLKIQEILVSIVFKDLRFTKDFLLLIFPPVNKKNIY